MRKNYVKVKGRLLRILIILDTIMLTKLLNTTIMIWVVKPYLYAKNVSKETSAES